MNRSRQDVTAAAAVVERRYRRLLACYPPAYRSTSENEMLGVALAGTAPGQRWPLPGEIGSLIVGGTRMRLGFLLSAARGPAWRTAAEACAFLAATLLATSYAQTFATQLVPVTHAGAGRPAPSGIVLAAGWALVATAAALGWRRATAVLGSLGVIGEGVLLAAGHSTSNLSTVAVPWWQLIVAATAALAALTCLAGPAPGRRALSRRVMATVMATSALTAVGPLLDSAFTTVTPFGRGYVAISQLGGAEQFLRYGPVAAMGVTLLLAVSRLAPPVRRRVLIMFMPGLAAASLVNWTFDNMVTGPWMAHQDALASPSWAELVVALVLGLVIGAVWLRRDERRLGPTTAGLQDTAAAPEHWPWTNPR